MIIRIAPEHPIAGSDITPPSTYLNRRQWLSQTAWAVGAGGLASSVWVNDAQAASPSASATPAASGRALKTVPSTVTGATAMDKLTPFKDVTSYNNFYEFGMDKDDPAKRSGAFVTEPWTLRVEGLVNKPLTLGLDDLMKLAPLEERIYRLRCVEAWSMVIPWVGYSLAKLIDRVQPQGSAKYLAFESAADPKTMPGVASSVIDWPYLEGLRMDEAMHPLTLLGLGLYGQVMPKQNGAPVRLVVPWKYGFKSAKSIVRIRFVEQQPPTAWGRAAPREYGFYSNVNPEVDHPRWSQARERRIGEDGLFAKPRKTLMFNGYANEVASMYAGMDLRRFY